MSMFTVWLCCIQIWCASAVTAVSVPGVHVTHIDTERKLLQSEGMFCILYSVFYMISAHDLIYLCCVWLNCVWLGYALSY